MEREYKVVMGGLVVFEILLVLFALPIQSETKYYPLATQQEINTEILNINTKRDVSGGLIQNTSDSINFMIQEGDSKVSKTVEYKDDVRFEPNSRNEIHYTEKKNIFGQTLFVEDVVVTYDENLFKTN